MQTSIEKLDGNLVKLTVTVPAETVDQAVKETYKQIAQEMKIPGFRKGHVPPKVIDNYIGREQVFAQVQERVVGDAYPVATNEHALRTIDQPDIGEAELPEEGAEYSFVAEVPVRPELTLSSYEGISVAAPSDEFDEADVEAEIDDLRDRFSTLELAEDGGVGEKDFAQISFVGLIEGEEYEGNRIEMFLYEMGKGQMPDEFEEALLGAKAGDKVEAAFVIPDSSFRIDLVGKEATFDIEVHEVKHKVLPDVDDELAQNAGYDDLETMKKQLRDRVEATARFERARIIETEAQKALIENLEGEIPDVMLGRRTNEIIRDFMNSLENQNVTIEQYTSARGLSLEDLEAEFGAEAQRSLAVELALEALFRALDYEVTEEDVDAELREITSDEEDVASLRSRFEAAGILPALHEQVMQHKATTWLLENIEITELAEEEEE